MVAESIELDYLESFIADKVRELREKKNLTQLEVANLMGFDSPSFYGNAEGLRQGKKFNLEHLLLLSKIYEVEIKDFLPKREDFERVLAK